MQYSQEHLKTMVYAEFGGQTECIMGNSKIENGTRMDTDMKLTHFERDSVAGNEVLLRNAMGLSSIIEPTFKSFTKS